jgi:cellobiose-specific phosphotransferase system component IIC
MDEQIERKIEKSTARSIAKWIAIAVAAIVGISIFIFLGGKVVQLLWNWLLPPLFGWRELTYWQALGMLALCRILFGGFGGHGGSRRGQKWTPEEKERFRQRMRAHKHWGWGGQSTETPQQ